MYTTFPEPTYLPHVMKRESPCSVEEHHNFHHANISDADVLASLWEHVPFPRLPVDAPKELAQYVVEIENPKRVYAIHRASRRHNFQLLVEKYIIQLRQGCNSLACSTPTCLSFRKRHAGKIPLRIYNTTSARILAVYLASQDNPENGLCSYLVILKAAPASLASLTFEPKRPFKTQGPDTELSELREQAKLLSNSSLATPTPYDEITHAETRESNTNAPSKALNHVSPPTFVIKERPISKDYRSFAANVFGTVAFKMLEWLTPNGFSAMEEKAEGFQMRTERNRAITEKKTPSNQIEKSAPPKTPSRSHQQAPQKSNDTETPTRSHSRSRYPERSLHSERSPHLERSSITPVHQVTATSRDMVKENSLKDVSRDPLVEWGSGLPPRPVGPIATPRADRPGSQRRSSNARVRAASSSKPKKPRSIDTLQPGHDEMLSGLRSSLLTSSNQPEKATKPFMTTTTPLTRSVPQVRTEEIVPRTTSPEPIVPLHKVDIPPVQEGATWAPPKPNNGTEKAPSTHGVSESTGGPEDAISDIGPEMLPQTLSILNLEIIDLLCDILQEDGTSEQHLLEPSSVRRFQHHDATMPKTLRRRRNRKREYPMALKRQWKIFIEQSLYNVLSDPHAVVSSFTTENGLLDSRSLWYCMLRITRVAPSLVLDSLWHAASSLFTAPKRLQNLRSPTSRFFRISERSLTSEEASHFMAICLHVLVAMAPIVEDTTAIFEVSRLRSNGLSIDNAARYSSSLVSLCLQYDDALSDELALRLARRLFSAIATRRGFKELVENDLNFDSESPEIDVLDTILSQIESIIEDPITSSSLLFSHTQCETHGKRVPTLLLDWARAVMLSEWDGKPDVAATGPFGGALALVLAMYQRRHALHIGDADFRSDYFPDRLDSVEMPIAWLAHSSTRQRHHLLDYPFMFTPSTLISYFRAINFSRMNRAYEESTSLLQRMRHISAQGNLINNEDHQQLVSNMLKTASNQYLVLEIRRKNPLKDAFDQLWRREERELLRPLKVHLGEESGEEGFDSGGVQQEFFRLAMAQALDPAFGLFTIDDRTRMTWFRPGGLEAGWKFELVGLLIGLAVYNGLTLPVTFPKALYRKLLGESVTEIQHIADGWPDLANGLTTLLEWDESNGAVEDVFTRTYEFSVEVFGIHVSREMVQEDNGEGTTEKTATPKQTKWPQWLNSMAPPTIGNPEDASMVTGENRNAYVSDYIRYLTHVSVAPQYKAFSRGFRSILHPKSLSLLSSNLLQNLVEGIQTIDISELRRHTRYVGWDATHHTVKDFWSIIKRYDESTKRKLLEFVTASDRVPVGGMRNLQFVVQKNGVVEEKDGHLPTAYTCYGTLLLPEYPDKEILRERLAMALENSQGFGFA